MINLWTTKHQWLELGYDCGGVESYDHNIGHTTRIALNPSTAYKSKWPMILAHELGHAKTNCQLDRRMRHVPYYEWRCEVLAWLWALQRLPPDEIDIAYLGTCLLSYVGRRDRQQRLIDIENVLTVAQARKEGKI